MPSLEIRVPVGDSNNGLYQVSVTDSDPGEGGGGGSSFQLTSDLSTVTTTAFEAAIQAFADSIVASSPTLSLVSITKTVVSDTTL